MNWISSAPPLLFLFGLAFALHNESAFALLIGMPDHTLSSEEVSTDTSSPSKVQIVSTQIKRGHSRPPGTWVEDADTGSLTINITPPTDDRTPASRMGYRIHIVGGCLPKNFYPPLIDKRAVFSADPSTPPYLVLYWREDRPTSPTPLSFQIGVAAVDLAGNVGAESVIYVRDPVSPPSASCASGARRCPDGVCRPLNKACPIHEHGECGSPPGGACP